MGTKNKLLPHNLDAEKAVLGAILVKNELMDEVFEILPGTKFFYSAVNQKIYSVMIKLHKGGKGVDTVLITNEMQRRNELEVCGGWGYLSRLIEDCVALSNVSEYAKVVKDKSVLRQLIEYSLRVREECFKEELSADEILDKSQKNLGDIELQFDSGGLRPVSAVLGETLNDIEAMCKKNKDGHSVPGIPTGFRQLDILTNGLLPNVYTIAARPSMGKTSFAVTLVYNAAVNADKIVAVFSLEESDRGLGKKLLSGAASVNGMKINGGFLNADEWVRITDAAANICENDNIFIDDFFHNSISKIKSKCRRLKREKDRLDMIVIDYLQLMGEDEDDTGSKKYKNRERIIADISRAAVGLKKEFDVPVLLLSQLSRNVENRQNKRPLLADLRESGAIEQDADVVFFLYRDEVYNKDSDDKGNCEIIIGKHRGGPLGTVKTIFRKEFMHFEDMAYEEEASQAEVPFEK